MKPTQEEIDTTLDVLIYALRDVQENEPHATNTIADLEAVIDAFPSEPDEFGEIDE